MNTSDVDRGAGAGREGLWHHIGPVLFSSHFHAIHHQRNHRFFECNYGTVDAPWDRRFGSDHDGSDEASRRRRERMRRRRRPVA